MTDNLFCLPCDTAFAREALPLHVSFEFVVGNRTDVPPNHTTGWRTMPFHLCCTHLNGGEAPAARIELKEGESRESSARDLVFIPAGVTHRIIDLDEKVPAVSLWMHFRYRAMTVFDIFDFYQLPMLIPAVQSARLIDWMEQLIALPPNLDFTGSIEQQRLGCGFCAELFSFGKIRTDRAGSFDYNRRRILPAMQRLAAAQTPPPLEELARGAHLSPSRFLAVFRQATGMSPGKFFEYERYRRACLLLMRDRYSIGEIAAMLGYCSPFHFSEKFRQSSGMSPSAFRKAHAGPKP